MGKFFGVLFLLFTTYSFGQITISDDDENPVSSENIRTPRTNESEFYFGLAYHFTDRILKTNEGLFGQEIEERAEEVGQSVVSPQIGIRSYLSSNFALEIGLGYSRNREYYIIETPDTLYEYLNTYRHISFPLKLAFTTGDLFSFYGGAGITPKAFLSRRSDIRFKEENGFEREIKEVSKEGYNTILFDASATLGTFIEFSPVYGFYFLVEGNYQVNSNYSNQAPFIRQPYSYGIHFGFHVYL